MNMKKSVEKKYQNDIEYREKKRKENLERYHKYKKEGKNFNQYIGTEIQGKPPWVLYGI